MKVGRPEFNILKKNMTAAHTSRKTYDNGAVLLGIPTVHARYHLHGEGVRVLLIDDGYTPHYNLPYPECVETFGNWSTAASETGHGNYMLGVMAMQGEPYTGIAPRASYLIAKYRGNRGGTLDDLERAIRYGVDQQVDMIVISSGVNGIIYHRGVHEALQSCYIHNIAVHLTTGNAFGKPISFPGNLSEVITTGAIDLDNKIALFNSSGDEIDFVCYGIDVLSTNNHNSHDTVEGSSFANPYAAGIGVLLMQYFRNVMGRKPDILEYMSLMARYAKDLTTIQGWDDETGFGIPTTGWINETIETEAIDRPRLSQLRDKDLGGGCMGFLF